MSLLCVGWELPITNLTPKDAQDCRGIGSLHANGEREGQHIEVPVLQAFSVVVAERREVGRLADCAFHRLL